MERLDFIRLKLMVRYDAKDPLLALRLPFALCKEFGIETEGMEPHEAWEALRSKTGKVPAEELEKAIARAREKLGISEDKPAKKRTTKKTEPAKPKKEKETVSKPKEVSPKEAAVEPEVSPERESSGKKIGGFSKEANRTISSTLEDYNSWSKKMDGYYGDAKPDWIKEAKSLGEKIKSELNKVSDDTTSKELSYSAEVITDLRTGIKDLLSRDWTGHPLRKENVEELDRIFGGIDKNLKEISDKVEAGEVYKETELKGGTEIDAKCETLKNFGKKLDEFRKSHASWFSDEKREAKVQENLGKIFENAEFCCCINSEYINNTLNEHLKCLHETRRGDGCTDRRYRRSMSEKVFGTEKGVVAHNMEKYGFLQDKDVSSYSELVGGVWYGGTGRGDQVCLILRKDNMKDRTSYSSSDSLSLDRDKTCGMVDTVCTTEGLSYTGYDRTADRIASGSIKRIRDFGTSYVEAQYHGLVTAPDIAEIRCRNKRHAEWMLNSLDDSAKSKLVKNGIKVIYDDGGWKEYDLSSL